MRIIGIDLAWQTEKNPSAVAIGRLDGEQFYLEALHSSVLGLDHIIALIAQQDNVSGISVDAPLIINNQQGQRECEKALNACYRSRHAGCHPSNLGLYPDAGSVKLANYLHVEGFKHLGRPGQDKWQIECYPHPALVEFFQLDERLRYKKGGVAEKKRGQLELASLIKSLALGRPALQWSEQLAVLFEAETILGHRGHAIKQQEDALDAMVCAYIGACYASGVRHTTFGNAKDGYIYVPQHGMKID